jgi:hypothetical protein
MEADPFRGESLGMNRARKRTGHLHVLVPLLCAKARSPKRRESDGDGVPLVLERSGSCPIQGEGEQVSSFFPRREQAQMRKSCSMLRRDERGDWRAVCEETRPHGSQGGGRKRTGPDTTRKAFWQVEASKRTSPAPYPTNWSIRPTCAIYNAEQF